MKEFMFLLWGGYPDPSLSPEQMQRHMQKWTAWVEQLAESGRLRSGLPLERAGKLVSGPNKLVTDGPFPEAKEVVGGYFIISAHDINEAVEISKGCPIFADGGAVEVRPIMEMSM